MLQNITQLLKSMLFFLMVPNTEGWYYLSVKKRSALIRGITSKHHGDFYCQNCLYSFLTEKKVESHKKYVKIEIFVTL